MNFLMLAQQYHASGFNLIPVGGDKRPLRMAAGSRLPTDDPATEIFIFAKSQVLPWGAGGLRFDVLRQSQKTLLALPWARAKGIAAICGAVSGNMVCVDFDHFSDPPLAFLEKLKLDTAYPWLYRTGGGFQAWFHCPDFALPSANKLDRRAIDVPLPEPVIEEGIPFINVPHIELRWNGHYAILPPSLHPSGKRYAFLTNPEEPPTQAPSTLNMSVLLAAYDAVTAKPEPEKKSTPPPPTKTKKKYLDAAIQGEVEHLNTSPTGQGNDDLYTSAMKLGGFVRSGELPESEFYTILLGTGAASRRPESEARATIASGLKNAEPRHIPEPKNTPPRAPMPANIPTPETLNTFPYIVGASGIQHIRYRPTKDGFDVLYEPIADFSARITQQIRDEHGSLTYQIMGETIHKKKFTLTIDAKDFEEASKCAIELGAAAGANAGINVGMARHLPYALKRLSGTDTPEIRAFKRTGWWQGRFLIPGRNMEGVTITLPGDLPYSINTEAEQGLALPALEALIQSVGAAQSMVVLPALFGAPLANLVGFRDERYTMLIYGRTGKFKTSFAQTALCIYGEGFGKDKALIKWGDGATENAIEAIASHAHDLPILVDNYKPNTGGGERVLVRVIHRLSEGGAKKRLNRDSELRETPDLYAWLLMTGEDTAITDTAMIARQLWVNFDDQPENASELLAQAQSNAAHLPSIGNLWISYLESTAGQKLVKETFAKFQVVQRKMMRRLLKANPAMITSNPQRLARNIAYNSLVFAVMCQHPVLGPIFKKYEAEYLEGIREVTETMALRAVESNPALMFLQGLRYALDSGKGILLDDFSTNSVETIEESESRRMIGYKAPDGGAYLFPLIAIQLASSLVTKGALDATTNNMLYKRLDELGYIASRARDSHLVQKRIRGKNMRVLHLTAEAISPSEKKTEPDDPEPSE